MTFDKSSFVVAVNIRGSKGGVTAGHHHGVVPDDEDPQPDFLYLHKTWFSTGGLCALFKSLKIYAEPDLLFHLLRSYRYLTN